MPRILPSGTGMLPPSSIQETSGLRGLGRACIPTRRGRYRTGSSRKEWTTRKKGTLESDHCEAGSVIRLIGPCGKWVIGLGDANLHLLLGRDMALAERYSYWPDGWGLEAGDAKGAMGLPVRNVGVPPCLYYPRSNTAANILLRTYCYLRGNFPVTPHKAAELSLGQADGYALIAAIAFLCENATAYQSRKPGLIAGVFIRAR